MIGGWSMKGKTAYAQSTSKSKRRLKNASEGTAKIANTMSESNRNCTTITRRVLARLHKQPHTPKHTWYLIFRFLGLPNGKCQHDATRESKSAYGSVTTISV